ncbi:MAG: putative porin [Bacteroidia bacterium]|nr:putative porin [Bacteroidia bacterium]
MKFLNACILVIFSIVVHGHSSTFRQAQCNAILTTSISAMHNNQGSMLPDSVSSNSDTIPAYIQAWKLNDTLYTTNNIKFDTLLFSFQIFHPAYTSSISPAFLGNIGQPCISNVFIQRNYNSSFIFFKPYEIYALTPENTIYFNTKRHYTSVFYLNGGQKQSKEQLLQVLHTQNINKFLNAGIRYNISSSLGQYKNQNSKLASASVFSNYTGERYNVHLTANYNKFRLLENGGLTDDLKFEEYDDPRFLEFNFSSGTYPKTLIVNKNIQIHQNYHFLEAINDSTNCTDSLRLSLNRCKAIAGHTARFEDSYRLYQDNAPNSGFYHGQYIDKFSPLYNDSLQINYIESLIPIFIDGSMTYDSVHFRSLKNTLFFEIPDNYVRKALPGIRIAGGNDIYNYYYYNYDNIQSDELNILAYGYTNILQNNFYVFSSLFTNNETRKISWNLTGKYYINGYKANDILMYGGIQKKFVIKNNSFFLSMNATFNRIMPDIIEEHYFSNHFKWDSIFLKKDISHIRLMCSVPSWHINAGIQQSMLDNYIYFDNTGYPRQQTHTFNIITLFINKKFQFWKFTSDNKFIYQKSGNEGILPLPQIVFYNSTAFYHNFKFKLTGGNLETQAGFDLYYNSKFMGYEYIPATNQFIVQNEKEIGGYPYIDPYVSLKLKRARFFIKFSNINALFMKHSYYTVLHYPMNGFMLRYGISWAFYD